MLEKILKFFPAADAGAEAGFSVPDEDLRISAAALMVNAARIDGRLCETEAATMRRVLAAHFQLNDEEANDLIRRAELRDNEAVDLYEFTSVLAKNLDQPGRKAIVGMLWRVVLADGEKDALEDNLVYRVAELLGVSTRDRVLLRQEAADHLASQAG